ncbi:MAG: hypothetical protein NZ879_06090 [Archaeoglobaceae archaeon]|nr:hypothetical protein [Archaeoglobaceae archaeon]MDW8118538.1 hypothetical protein [Archaeoglobaceae archaeon]
MILLHLSGHCIETSAKKKYQELLSYLLKQEDEEKEKELELLIEFLKTMDFSELRREGFDGREEMTVVIKKEKGKLVVERLS